MGGGKAPKTENVVVYEFKHAAVGDHLLKALSDLALVGEFTSKTLVSIDKTRNRVLLRGPEEEIKVIFDLFDSFDQPVDPKVTSLTNTQRRSEVSSTDQTGADSRRSGNHTTAIAPPQNQPAMDLIQVRLIWLVADTPQMLEPHESPNKTYKYLLTKDLGLKPIPPGLEPTVQALANMGLSRIAMAGQITILTNGKGDFGTSGSFQTHGTQTKTGKHELTFRGNFIDPATIAHSPHMRSLGVTVTSDTSGLDAFTQINTQIQTVADHQVVLGMNPSGDGTNVFVLSWSPVPGPESPIHTNQSPRLLSPTPNVRRPKSLATPPLFEDTTSRRGAE